MVCAKALLIFLVLALSFVSSAQAQTNISIAEAEAADENAKHWLRMQNTKRAGGVRLLQPITATMSSQHAHFSAAKCIDGDTEGKSDELGNGSEGNMCSTQHIERRAPWLAIDYGAEVTVNRVELFNREDCCGDRTRNVDVRVSNQLPTSANEMFSGGFLLGHFAGPGTNGQHISIIGQAVSGRYVIIQMDNGEGVPLNLREVRAFGPKVPACANDKCVETCDEGWEKNGNHCYLWVTEKKTWTNAEDFCQEKGGHLASVSSNETMGYVLALRSRQNKPHVWLGGNVLDQEGIWKWTDCTHWEFEFWAPGIPDNSGGVEHCLHIYQGTDNPQGFWNDVSCSWKTDFLCSQKLCPPESNNSNKGENSSTTTATNTSTDTCNGENDMLLIGSFSLSGGLLLLLLLQTIGVICFVCKNRSRKNAVKKDVNPLYGANNVEDAAEENKRRVSNSENYDYMGV